MKYKIFFLITAFYLYPLIIYSQINENNNVHEVFVTGQAIPASSTRAEIGSTIITSKDIEEMKPNTLDEVLRTVSGIVIRQNGAGKLTTLSIRGGNSGTAMLMIDSMPVNDIAGINNDIDLSSIPIDNIEKIEIIKGAAGASLGSSAMSGAINIITKKGGKKEIQAESDIQSSLLNLNIKGNASLFGSYKIIDYRAGGSISHDEGISAASSIYGNTETDPDTMGEAFAYLNIKPVDDLSTSFHINYANRKSHIDGKGGTGGDALDYLQYTKRVNTMWNTRYLYKDIWEPALNIGYTYSDRIYGSSKEISNNTNDIFDGHNLNIDFQNNVYIVDEFTLTLGLNYEYNQIYTRSSNNYNIKNRQNYAGYIQGTINYKSWITVLALRGQKEGVAKFIPIYRVSTVYDIEQIDLQLKASVGTGAKAPSLYQLYDPVFGSRNLQLQESLSYEIGFTNGLFKRKLIYGLSWFDNFYNNIIEYGSYIDNDNSIKTGFYNEGNTRTRGIEASIQAYPVKWVDMYIYYTWLQTFNSFNNPLARRPEHQVQAGLNIKPIDKLYILLSFLYSGESPASNYDTKINDDYFLLNTVIGYKINNNIEIYLKGNNLTNTIYEEIAGYGTKGLEVFAGLKMQI